MVSDAQDLIGRLRKSAATTWCTYVCPGYLLHNCAGPDIGELLSEAADALAVQGGIVESGRRGALVDGVVRVVHHAGAGCGAFRRQWLQADDWALVTCERCLKQAGKPVPPVKDAPLPEGVHAVSSAILPPPKKTVPKEDKW